MARTTATIDDRLILYGTVPPRTRQRIQDAVTHGLDIVRRKVGLREAASVRCWIVPRIRHGAVSQGYTTKRFINIMITKMYVRGRTFSTKLSGTVIHEYVHFLRLHAGRHTAKTVLDAMIEEGIAIFMQTRLSAPPEYLAINTLDEAMVRLCWEKLSDVLDQPARKYPQVEENDIYRTLYYRLGFGIVRRFLRQHRQKNLNHLIRVSEKTLGQFAYRTYGKERRASIVKRNTA